MKTHVLTFIILLLISVNNLQANDRQVVKVGGYHFPPFVEDINAKGTGITLDLIEVMNSYQNKYRFEFVLTSSKRRFDHFNEGKYDMIMFEAIDWGWKGRDVEATKVYLEGGSKFITKASPYKDQSYFNTLKGKSMLLIIGYHYAFADFNTDPEYLKKNFNATMTPTHEGNILSIVKGRADIAVVIYAFLQKFLCAHPSIKEKIIVSEKFENRNYYTSLIRKNTEPNVNQMNNLLSAMEKDGVFAKFWLRYGIK